MPLPRLVGRTYEDVIKILESRRRPHRPTIRALEQGALHKIPDNNGLFDVRGTPSIVGMKEWLGKVGHSAADINNLNIIHVAGTKGKGGTSAFAESFLRSYGQRTGFPAKTGLYTSPHLLTPEERIRINFNTLPRDVFAKYFFEVWDVLHDEPPRYLQLFAILAIHIFLHEGVGATVIETHHGGEYDATNVIEGPIATVITPIGIDHAKQLGPTTRNIAWHKSGIFKPGAVAVSAQQEANVVSVLKSRASDKEVTLHFTRPEDLACLPKDMMQLTPDVQRDNASLALTCIRLFLEQVNIRRGTALGPILPEDILDAVGQFSWSGRFQHIAEKDIDWFLDGAHNEMSVPKAAGWFIDALKLSSVSSSVRIVIFAQNSNQRDSVAVVEALASSLQSTDVQHAIFAAYFTRQKSPGEGRLSDFAEVWRKYKPESRIQLEKTIENAVETVRRLRPGDGRLQVLVTGSIHAIGVTLQCLQWSQNHES